MNSSFDYISSFYEGGKWAEYVAELLRTQKVRCTAPPIKIAKSQSERDFMTKHERDIVFDWSDICLEVKSSSRSFTDAVDDYPFQSLFVDTVSSFDSKVQKPLAYVFVSQVTGSVICISSKSHVSWRQVERFDKQRQITDFFYSASKHLLIPFDDLVEHLLKHQDRLN